MHILRHTGASMCDVYDLKTMNGEQGSTSGSAGADVSGATQGAVRDWRTATDELIARRDSA